MEGNNICASNVNITVLQILKESGVKEVTTLLPLTGMLMGIGIVLFMLWFSDFHVQNLLAILTNSMGPSPMEAIHSLTAQKFYSCNEN